MTVGRKLIFAFSALLLILLTISISLYVLADGSDAAYTRAVDVSAKKLFLIGEVNTARADLRASLRATILYSYAKRPELVESNHQKTVDAANRALQLLDQLEPLIQTEEGRRSVRDIRDSFQLWKEKFDTVYSYCKAGDAEQAEAYGTRETKSIAENTGTAIGNLITLQQQLFESDKATQNQRASLAKYAAIFAILVSIGAALVVLKIIFGITRKLTQIVGDLSAGSEQVACAAIEISNSSQSLAQGASEQAASLQETSSSATEIVSMTKQNAENSKSVMALMNSASQQIDSGNQRLDEMQASMSKINGSAENISRIIKTIDEIAFQTNILALNAAVEAARAGTAGMGFAVVADEVRSLAQRCAQAAKDTAALIEESIDTTHEGSEKLAKVAESIAQITAEANSVKVLVEEVSLSSQEQARGLQQISKSVEEMELVTQRTAASAEESASAGEELSAQSQTLQSLVQNLRDMVIARA